MTAAAWHPDPTGRHELRYWDGSQWTEHVSDGGVQSASPLTPPEEPGAHTGGSHAAEESAAEPAGSESAAAEPFAGDPLAAEPLPAEPMAEAPAMSQAPAAQPMATPSMAAQPMPGGAPSYAGTPGISGELVDGRFSEVSTGPGPSLQNNRLLRVRIAEPFMARQGAMVAYQGNVNFAYQGAGGAAKVFKRALTGEGLSLMRVEGAGDVFLADSAKHVHLLNLTNSGISVNGASVLAFSTSLEWNVERVKGGSIAAGGLFNTTLRGTGWVAITTDGDPVVLNAAEAQTFADTDAIVAWSADLQTSLRSTMSAGALIGRGSGEAVQVTFAGQGFVIVQPSESGVVPPHTH